MSPKPQPPENRAFDEFRRKLLLNHKPVGGARRQEWFEFFQRAVKRAFPDRQARVKKPGAPDRMLAAEVATPGEYKTQLMEWAENFGKSLEKRVRPTLQNGDIRANVFLDRLDAVCEFAVLEGDSYLTGRLKLRNADFRGDIRTPNPNRPLGQFEEDLLEKRGERDFDPDKRRSFGKPKFGDRKPYQRRDDDQGGRKPYQRRDDKGEGGRPYQRRGDVRGGRKPYQRRDDDRGGRKPYGKPPGRRSRDGDNGDRRGGYKKPYQKRDDDRRGGYKKPYKRDGDRKPYGKKPYNKDRRFGKDRPPREDKNDD
jgi:hypothetical protein